MSQEVETVKRKAHFVKYVSNGRRRRASRNSSEGGKYHFQDGVWVEISEADAEKFKADAKVNTTWEYKEEEVIIEASHHYAKFGGVKGKKVANVTLYDKDGYGQNVPGSERKYVMPKGDWVLIQDKDTSFFQPKANANAHWDFETIQLPSNLDAPIKLEKQSPTEYREEVMNRIKTQEKEALLKEQMGEVEELEDEEEEDE